MSAQSNDTCKGCLSCLPKPLAAKGKPMREDDCPVVNDDGWCFSLRRKCPPMCETYREWNNKGRPQSENPMSKSSRVFERNRDSITKMVGDDY